MPSYKPRMAESKKDDSIPYTYEARIDRLGGRGDEPLDHTFFADTLCGLVELMAEEDVAPADVRFFAVYQGEITELEVERCCDERGAWIVPPRLCHALETHYAETKDERYRGHVEHGSCCYEDRDTQGHGPY